MSEFLVRDQALMVRDNDKKIFSRVKIEADSDKRTAKTLPKPTFRRVKRKRARDHALERVITDSMSGHVITRLEGVIMHPERMITCPGCVSTRPKGRK